MRIQERITLFRSIAIYVRSGMPLVRALTLQADAARGAANTTITGLADDIANGHKLSACLATRVRHTSALETGIIAAGEASGTLPESLDYLADMLERQVHLRNSVRTALVYPTIVFAGAAGISLFIILYALPHIIPLFTAMHARLPLSTRIVLAGYTGLRADWPFLCATLVLAALGCHAAWKIKRVRRFVERVLLVLPLSRTIIRHYYGGVLCRLVGTLIARGVRIDEAVTLASRSIAHLGYQDSLHELAEHIRSGLPASIHLRRRPDLYPADVAALTELGEATGTLSVSFAHAADICERRLAASLRIASSALEPALLAFAGGTVGFIALSIISPIYSLTQSLAA